MISRVVVLTVFCLLAGCNTIATVRATSAAADSVTYEFPIARRDEARRQAMLYCANLGRTAVLRDVEAKADGFATAAYDCR